jgi:hypothetical protein
MEEKNEQEFRDEVNKQMEVMIFFDSVRADRNIYDFGGNILIKGEGCFFPPVVRQPIKIIDPKYSWYEEKLVTLSSSENINGYQLNDCNNNIFDFDDFLEIYSIWKENKQYTYSKFDELCRDIMCTDWHKIDRHSNFFGGFWRSEDSDERDNAIELTKKDNIKGLYELPYPKDFIFETIKIGCGNRRESVKYSNFLCVWFERKMELCQDELALI